MGIRRFEDLDAWKRARELCVEIYGVTARAPFSRDFGLCDQVRRAAVSIMSNIAEGFARYRRSETLPFLRIALGSASEVRCQLYIALDLDYLSEEEHARLSELCVQVSRILGGLHRSLQSRD